MILEGIVTTLNEDESVNISPMGPIVDEAISQLTLRPYPTSTTLQNLKRTGQGVLHVTDDVELLARAAVNQIDQLPDLAPVTAVDGYHLTGACRWYAFRVQSVDEQQQPARLQCTVVDRGRLRDFFGFNRAKHAVVEAAILATRIRFLPADEILSNFQRWRSSLTRPLDQANGEPSTSSINM